MRAERQRDMQIRWLQYFIPSRGDRSNSRSIWRWSTDLKLQLYCFPRPMTACPRCHVTHAPASHHRLLSHRRPLVKCARCLAEGGLTRSRLRRLQHAQFQQFTRHKLVSILTTRPFYGRCTGQPVLASTSLTWELGELVGTTAVYSLLFLFHWNIKAVTCETDCLKV